MSRSSRPISVTLGAYQEKVDERVASGAYASASEVVRAGLRALEREEEVLEIWMRDEVRRRLADPQPGDDMDAVFDRLETRLTNPPGFHEDG